MIKDLRVAIRRDLAGHQGASGVLELRYWAERIRRRNRAASGILGHPVGMQPAGWTRRVHRTDDQQALHHGGNGWHQPGRRFGPSPLGPEHPKANKLTDKDGNARIAPLTYDQRTARYVFQGFKPFGTISRRQQRRATHKRNHAAAPFNPKDIRQ